MPAAVVLSVRVSAVTRSAIGTPTAPPAPTLTPAPAEERGGALAVAAAAAVELSARLSSDNAIAVPAEAAASESGLWFSLSAVPAMVAASAFVLSAAAAGDVRGPARKDSGMREPGPRDDFLSARELLLPVLVERTA